jgi:hypothetical protein
VSTVEKYPPPLSFNPDQLPLTVAEGNMLTRAIVELLERVEVLESLTGANELQGDAPDGSGLRYTRSRNDQVQRGIWGERGVAKVVEKMYESRRPGRPELSDEERLKFFFQEEARKLRGSFDTEGRLHWHNVLDERALPYDFDGKERHKLAVQRAKERLIAAKNGGGVK